MVEANPDQPRAFFDEAQLEELAASIRVHGIIQPLLVREIDGRYQIIAGERRFRAAKLAGLKKVPVFVDNVSGQDQLEIALIENLQREDLNPMEESRAYQQLIARYDLSQEDVASRVGKARATVTNSLRLLKLPADVQEDIESTRLSAGHARALLSLSNFPTRQSRLHKAILDGDLSVRAAEKRSRELLEPKTPTAVPTKPVDPQIEALSDSLSEALGAIAKIKPSSASKGRIEITYLSLDELDGLLAQLGVEPDSI